MRNFTDVTAMIAPAMVGRLRLAMLMLALGLCMAITVTQQSRATGITDVHFVINDGSAWAPDGSCDFPPDVDSWGSYPGCEYYNLSYARVSFKLDDKTQDYSARGFVWGTSGFVDTGATCPSSTFCWEFGVNYENSTEKGNIYIGLGPDPERYVAWDIDANDTGLWQTDIGLTCQSFGCSLPQPTSISYRNGQWTGEFAGSVPVPPSILLLAGGLIGLGATGWRAKRR